MQTFTTMYIKCIHKCSPALQTSGQYTFWQCLVESRVTLRTVEKIRRRAVNKQNNNNSTTLQLK